MPEFYDQEAVDHVEAVLDSSPATAVDVYEQTWFQSERAIAAVAAHRAGGGGSQPVLQQTKKAISAANLLALDSVALQILPSPGAGLAYIIAQAQFLYTAGGNPYTGSINLQLGNGDGGGSAFVDAVQAGIGNGTGNFQDADGGFITFVPENAPAYVAPGSIGGLNPSFMTAVGMYLDNNGNPLTGGNGTAKLWVAYYTITLP